MTAPNVLLVLADDLGWGDLGCYGATAIPTPAIDELARRGTRFVDCHAVSSVCTPSRYGVVTGTYPWRSPLRRSVLGGPEPSILTPGAPTVATVLAAAGYATGAFGKWHLGLDWLRRDGSRPSAFDEGWQPNLQSEGRDVDYTAPFTNGPLDHGFERFFGIAGSLDMPPYAFLDQDRTLGIPSVEKEPLVTSQRAGLATPEWRDDDVDLRFLAEASAWVDRQVDRRRPFFAYVATAAPHRPCVPPEVVRGRSEAGPRGDGVCLVDHVVGSLVGLLDDLGVLESTLVLVASDNGAPTCFPEDGDVETHRPNGGWRGQKADVWEAGHRVPLVCAGPGVGVGVESGATVSLMDVLPTLAEAVGLPVPSGIDGLSFWPVLQRGSTVGPRLLGATAFDGSLVVRHGSRKAIYSSGSGGFSDPVGVGVGPDSGDGQLYDLLVDPGERINLWAGAGSEPAELYAAFGRETGYLEP